jgi:hypothetical protein
MVHSPSQHISAFSTFGTIHREDHEGHEGFEYLFFKLRALRAFVVKNVFTFWLRLRRAGSFVVKAPLVSCN